MKKTKLILSILLVSVLLSVCLVSCTKQANENIWDDATYTEDTELGEGPKTVYVEVKALDKSVTFTIHTDKSILGDALDEHGLVEGDEGQFGLYIKKVNGMRADYSIDGYYWSFEKNGEYMLTGIDSTEFSDGEHYELIYAK